MDIVFFTSLVALLLVTLALEVWGPSHAEDGHYVRVYMGHLRHKLEDDPARPRHILTETAVGYRLVQIARS